ncbi:hypothetical protein LSUE1_G001971 [Lachnellula suecica]|uniref:Uncharacterized protein n=1 Tax=Lachnellula suecica TaxID=602035 RepID=A0A8T9CIE4_9HELO|nr:hypothetical protein LSUE1_G001971 [Lachnellula suecica]
MGSSSPTLTRDELPAFAAQHTFLVLTSEVRLTQPQQPTRFLTLAPTTSASYPSSPTTSPLPIRNLPGAQMPKDTGLEVTQTVTPIVLASEVLEADLLKAIRSSSSGSDESAGSPTQQKGFLKLGAVHFGGDGKGDWSEDVIAE